MACGSLSLLGDLISLFYLYECEKSKLVKIDCGHHRTNLFLAGPQTLECLVEGERVDEVADVFGAAVHEVFEESLVLQQFQQQSLR